MRKMKAGNLARNGIKIGFLLATAVLAFCGKPSGNLSQSEQSASSPSAAKPVPAPKSVPSIPGALSALSEDGKVTLRWQAVEGVSAYNIYSASAAGVKPVKERKLASVKAPPFEHANLKNGDTHFYVVTAVNDTGESQPSMETGAGLAIGHL